MNQRVVKPWDARPSERGGARLKFFIVLAIIGSTAYAGYLYLPVQFDALRFKDFMQHEADVAATQGYQVTWVSEQVKKNLSEYNVPADAVITPGTQDHRVFVRVQYTRPIEFPGYTYQFEFDHTASSTDFLTVK
ncbi:MAG TPA: hypothetical protein VGN86_11070 [Pyrinomonadaceae bacterium]|nr:hypothetical protein [Pyrinomonadaceae bacterium]